MRRVSEAARPTAISRRRWLATAAALPLVAGALRPTRVRAAAHPIPQPLLDLGTAAMKLFDAAEAGKWDRVQTALKTVQADVDRVQGIESAYTEAGGELYRFFEASRYLDADLVDARAAASVLDRPWLMSTADNILSRIGDLNEPFTDRSDMLLPRLEALLFLTRRMRRALAWEDEDGFASARRDFDRLWSRVRGEIAAQAPARVKAINQTLAEVERNRTVPRLRKLYAEVHDLLQATG